MKKNAIYALTPKGAPLGRRIADQLGGDLFLPARLAALYNGKPFDSLRDLVAEHFSSYPCHIFVAASGIVVRVIAPLLKSKDKDPAVLVLDQDGRYVISLLSGHLGGANEEARSLAGLIGGQAVVTTATDSSGLPSFDQLAKKHDMTITNLAVVKHVNMALLNGDAIQIFDSEDRLGLRKAGGVAFTIRWIETESQWIDGDPGVWVTWRGGPPPHDAKRLILHPRCLVVGIGCNRGANENEILQLIQMTFKAHDLAIESLKSVSTIEAKRHEEGLIETANALEVPLQFFGTDEIQTIEVPHPSGIVEKHMGVSSVCEATALLTAKGGPLLVPKTKSRNVTLAIALEN